MFSYCSHEENNLLWGQISFTAQESSEILLEELQIFKQENGNHPYIYWDEQKAFGKNSDTVSIIPTCIWISSFNIEV